LQEATRDVIAMAVADVLASMPIVPEDCRQMVENLKAAHKASASEDHPKEKPAGQHRAHRGDAPALPPEPRNPAPQPASTAPATDPDKGLRDPR
jgi:hypothetical protein